MSVLGAQVAAALEFPPGFRWGASTAAFQIEGATAEDGRTDSIWDAFCRRPGAVAGGDTGEPAADHYHRPTEDVALMRELGFGAYRFSVAWSRVRPDGGAANPRGLDFYDRLTDELLANGIEPWATLYHFDLPQALEETGGWANRDTAYRFAEFAATTVERLGDRIPFWSTLNEPWCSAFLGYGSGVHAPGRREPAAAAAAAHHLLLAHGLAMPELRRYAPSAQSGITLNLYPVSGADEEAVRRIDGLQNRLFLDPVLLGRYPDDLLADLAPFGFPVRDGDVELIGAPIDVLGVNYYRGYEVTRDPALGEPAGPEWIGARDVRFIPDPHAERTDSGWQVEPAKLTDTLLRVHRDYPAVPLYITENGAAYPDAVGPDGEIADTGRIAFLESHLRAAHAALAQGVDLRGFFYWSLLDNFEWAEGYAKRFGLVHVDYESQRRTPKRSAAWYAQVIAANGLG
ncbi:beta-glucosidase [Amycolatopsis bartoniae]|uniref:Beta-glucosidase n=1 Tax=Amycolatopsis bartoniae TaxID=941986 RepID=A0A8H9IWL7_9PSEU|nr:GH1 family beta-glucosidase [Amycolatopsis bartoniae]MBB2935832.1 beta-glucosidase [Amycolatopsis bartoniae]TVT04970.1 beta-glucosidase [Amycolatopsis bartoniae]GHF62165.1 beta-glucosidase [Amycolatopsis bartoniae]